MDKLILERDELAQYLALYIVVDGREIQLANTNYEQHGSAGATLVQQIAENMCKYSTFRLVERDIDVDNN